MFGNRIFARQKKFTQILRSLANGRLIQHNLTFDAFCIARSETVFVSFV